MKKTDSPSAAILDNRVTVVIVDDHYVVRLGLRALLEVHNGLRVVGEAATGKEAAALIQSTNPAVVLLDLRLPDIDGMELCRNLKSKPPSPAVIILTSYADDRTVMAAIEAGADGYLLKQAAQQDIPSIILTVAAGGSVLDPLVARRVLQAVQGPKPSAPGPHLSNCWNLLTSQETRVLEFTALGKSNRQIAQEMRLSEGTVRNYLSAIFSKLGVGSRVEAASLWLRKSTRWNQE